MSKESKKILKLYEVKIPKYKFPNKYYKDIATGIKVLESWDYDKKKKKSVNEEIYKILGKIIK